MKRKEIVSALFLAGAMLAMNSAPASAQSVGAFRNGHSNSTSPEKPVFRVGCEQNRKEPEQAKRKSAR